MPSRDGRRRHLQPRVLLDRRARDAALRPLGDRHPRVRVADPARLARRPDGARRRADRVDRLADSELLDASRCSLLGISATLLRFCVRLAGALRPSRLGRPFLLPALTESRLFFSASIRLTTFGGASVVGRDDFLAGDLRVDDPLQPFAVLVLVVRQVQRPLRTSRSPACASLISSGFTFAGTELELVDRVDAADLRGVMQRVHHDARARAAARRRGTRGRRAPACRCRPCPSCPRASPRTRPRAMRPSGAR